MNVLLSDESKNQFQNKEFEVSQMLWPIEKSSAYLFVTVVFVKYNLIG